MQLHRRLTARRFAYLLVPLLVPLISVLGACGAQSTMTDDLGGASTCGTDTRGETYLPGMSQPGVNKLSTVKLLTSNPGPPEKGVNTWMIEVDGADGMPIEGAKLSVTPFMPDHGHGTPIICQVTDMGGGKYQLTPLNLFMAGVWRVTVNVTLPGPGADAGEMVDQSIFYFCIEG